MGGTAVDPASEQHRHECEARTVMRWPREERMAYYGLVADKRGRAAAEALRDEVMRQHRIDLEGQA